MKNIMTFCFLLVAMISFSAAGAATVPKESKHKTECAKAWSADSVEAVIAYFQSTPAFVAANICPTQSIVPSSGTYACKTSVTTQTTVLADREKPGVPDDDLQRIRPGEKADIQPNEPIPIE